jgi:prophage maintenance system killer protein
MFPIFLDVDDVISINRKVIAEYGGIFGLRDRGLVEMSVSSVINSYYYRKLDLKWAEKYENHI